MTGQLFSSNAASPRLLSVTSRAALAPEEQRHFRPDAHTHLRLGFEDGGPEVLFRDVRRFGKVLLLEPGQHSERLDRLGIEALELSGQDLFRATVGDKAYWNDRIIEIADRGGVSQESLLLTFSRFHQGYECRFPGKIRDFGSTGAHACYVAMGRADAAFTANESFKDLAAVNVIIEAAGGQLSRIDGNPFLLGDYMEGQRIDSHLMVAGKSSIRPVLDCIRHQRT